MFDEFEQSLQRILLIFEQLDDPVPRPIGCSYLQQSCLESLFDQRLCDATLDFVKVLNDPGFDCPFTVHLFDKRVQ